MCSDKFEPEFIGVSLKDYLEKIVCLKFDGLRNEIALQFKAIDDSTRMARDLMQERMDGFPEQFVRKGESDIKLAELFLKVEILTDKIAELKGRLWSMGIIGAFLLVILEVVFRYLVNR